MGGEDTNGHIDSGQLLLDAVQCARLAGAVHLKHFRSPGLDTKAKINEGDIVTVADKAAEAAILDFIHSRYPSHSILAEESGADDRGGDYQWVIDPLDGTTNYSAGLPIFSVSIGVRRKGETVVGVVFAPYLNELFHAVSGGGAYLNGEPVRVRQLDDIRKAVVSTGFPVDKDVNPDNNLDNVARVLPRLRGLRRLGSAAVDLCYVAAGILDGFWELNLHEWDVCAGLLIAREAGAVCHRFRSDRLESVLVASPAIAAAILPLLSQEPFTGRVAGCLADKQMNTPNV